MEGAVELAVEILSPGDETYDKLPFYAAVGVREVLVVDPETLGVELFVLRGGRLHAALPDAAGAVVLASLVLTLSTVEGPVLRLGWAGGTAEIGRR